MITAGTNISLDVDGTERVRIIGIGIILIEWTDTIAIVRIERNRTGAEIYASAREQSHTPATQILRRHQEIRRQLMFHRQSPFLRVQIAAALPLQRARMRGLLL